MHILYKHLTGNWNIDQNDTDALKAAVLQAKSGVEWYALDVLGKRDDPQLLPFFVSLLQPNQRFCGKAAWALGRLATSGVRDAAAVDALIDALDDKDDTDRYWIVWALKQFGDKRAIEPLINHLDEPYTKLRADIVEALGSFGGTRVFEPLLALTAAATPPPCQPSACADEHVPVHVGGRLAERF